MRVVLFVLALATAALGQVSTGSVFGTVTDESGGAVSAAEITVEQEATGFARTVLTGGSGAYRVEELAPGAYSVQVRREGFRTAVARHVTVEVNQQARLDLRLTVGELRDSVTVGASVPLLETENSTAGYRIDSPVMTELPLDQRDVMSLVTLGPGAIPRQLGGFVHDADNDVQQGSRGSVALNAPINGARPSMNAFLLDGAYNTDRNVFAAVIAPPMDAVQEFRIQTSLSSAVFPSAAGGVVDVVTKTGSRTFHGGAFEYLRNEATDARNYFDDPAMQRSVFRRSQFGGSLGGPLPLPSTFFFTTYEGLRGRAAAPSLQLVPDQALRAGDFRAGNTLFDPLGSTTAAGRTPFAGNAIPAARIDPIARKYLDGYEPLPNRFGNPSGNYVDTTPSTSDRDSGSVRIDHQFRHAGTMFSRYTINDERGGIGGNFPLRPTSENLRAQQAVLGHTLAGALWTNEFRGSFTRLRLFDVPLSASQQNVAAALGIANAPADPFAFGLPYFFVADFSTVTDDPTLPQIQRDNTWGLSDTYSLVRGKHTLKAGLDWSHFQFNYRQSSRIRGQYTYSGVFTGNGTDPNSGDALADFLLGLPQSTQRSVGDSQGYMRQSNYGGFLEDAWQATSRVTLTLGVRCEYSSPFTEARNKLLNLDYSNLSGPPALVGVGSANLPNRRDFAPRAAIAWRLPGFLSSRGDTVFRAGYGVYFTPELAVEAYDLVLNGTRNEINNTDGSASPILTTANGFPASASTGFPTYFGVDSHLPTPYVQQWNAGFERELPGAVLLQASYIGSKGSHLGRFRRFNTALHTETGENLAPRPGDLQSLRPFPDLGTLFQFQHIANSSYNSLQLRAEKRMRRSLSFLASLVWSKSIDDSSTVIPGLFDAGGAQDERNLRLERGLSSFNVGRRISAGFVYSLPFRPRFGRVLAGWQLSGIVTIQDGTPLDPLYISMDTANAGTFTRPNIVPGQSISLPSSQRTPEHWFNTQAFSAPAPYQFGNAARDVIPGPGNEVVDLALHKHFTIAEGKGIELRAEGFNVFNHPNFGFPDPYPDQGPFFGRILITGQPRRVQFGARFDF
jgi:hypothetical protein